MDEIHISGNKWTKDFVLLRELNFKKGQSYPKEYLEEAKLENFERIRNLGLFNDVVLEYDYDSVAYEFDIKIEVVENWYIWPSPIFELADRNFAEWWTNQNRDITRVNYGLRVDHINLTGRRDRLILQIQTGFRQKYELVYNQPYLNKEGTLGAEAFVFFANQDQIPFKTENNRTIFGGFEERTLLERFRTGGAFFYRPTIYHHHAFRLEYHKNSVDQHVIDVLNPNYFLEGRTSIQFFMFNYHYTYDRRISQFIPVDGYLLWADIKKEGFGIFNEYNNTSASIGGEFYHPFNKAKTLVFGTQFKIKANLDRSVVSFANNTGIGWGADQLGGYHLYVVDGTDYAYARNNIRYKLFEKKFNFGKFMPFHQFRSINVQLYARAFLDVGFANDPTYRIPFNNDFNNRLLYGWGPGGDLLLYNNYMFSYNLGINHLKEVHLFFQYRTNF